MGILNRLMIGRAKNGNSYNTVPIQDSHRFGGLKLDVTPTRRQEEQVVIYKVWNKHHLIFPLTRTKELRPMKVERLITSIHDITGLEVTCILSKRGLVMKELDEIESTQEDPENPTTILGRIWVLVSLGYSVNGNIRKLSEDVKSIIGQSFEYLPIDQILSELNPFAGLPPINPRMKFLSLDLKPDYDMFTVGEIASLMASTGTTPLLRGSEIYLGTHPETNEALSINLRSLSNNMIMLLGTSGKGKSVLAGQIAYRIARHLLVIDVGGPDKQGIGWNSDPYLHTVKVRPNQLIDILTAEFQTEDSYIKAVKAVLKMCGIDITKEMMNSLSFLYHNNERGIEQLCEIFRLHKDNQEMRIALEAIERIKKEYEFITYPNGIKNVHFDISKADEGIPPNTYLLYTLIEANMSAQDDSSGIDIGLFKYAIITEELPKLLDSLERMSSEMNAEFLKKEVLRMLMGFIRDMRKREMMFLFLVHTYSEIKRVPILDELYQHCDLKLIFDAAPLHDPELHELMESYNLPKIGAILEDNRNLGGTTEPRMFCALVGSKLMLIKAQLKPNHLAIINQEYNQRIGKMPLIIKGELPAETCKDLKYQVYYPPNPTLPPITVYTPPPNDGVYSARISTEDKNYTEKTLASIVLGIVGTGAHGRYYLETKNGDKVVIVDGLLSEITFIRQRENILTLMNDSDENNIKNFIELLKFLVSEGIDLETLSKKWDGALKEHIKYAKEELTRA